MDIITLERKVLQKNDDIAAENRALFAAHDIHAINLLSSPGSGKTTLLEHTIEALSTSYRIGVIEGDVQTDNDARRIARHAVPVVQIVTNGLCHLEAGLVRDALEGFPRSIDLCVIENVGNLVCPAGYDLGEHEKVVLISVTEGDDKPEKYPAVFRRARLMVITKTDLLPYVSFDVEACTAAARRINPAIEVVHASCTTRGGLEDWIAWLRASVERTRAGADGTHPA